MPPPGPVARGRGRGAGRLSAAFQRGRWCGRPAWHGRIQALRCRLPRGAGPRMGLARTM